MKSLSALLPALCIAVLTTPIACGGMAVQSYIDNAKTSASLPKELEPPPCINGEEGKNAIIKAFRDSGPKPPGVLPLATFLSLSCYRVKEVEKRINRVGMSKTFVAKVPVDKEMLDTMVAAWSATDDEAKREEMGSQLLFLDHSFAFQLYARIQETDKPFGQGIGRPVGAFFPIEGASKEETETVRKAWCQYVGPGAYKRFFSEKIPLNGDGALIRDNEMAGLIGNQCPETDQMIVELIKRVDKNAHAQEDQWAASAPPGMQRAGIVDASKSTLFNDATGYPLISHLGKDITGRGIVDPNRTQHYLELLAHSGHSCAFGAEIKAGIEGALSVTPELVEIVGAYIGVYKEFLQKTCGDLP